MKKQLTILCKDCFAKLKHSLPNMRIQILSLGVFCIGMVLTLLVYSYIDDEHHERLQDEFMTDINRFEKAFQKEVELSIHDMMAIKGLFVSSNFVDVEEFDAFFEQISSARSEVLEEIFFIPMPFSGNKRTAIRQALSEPIEYHAHTKSEHKHLIALEDQDFLVSLHSRSLQARGVVASEIIRRHAHKDNHPHNKASQAHTHDETKAQGHSFALSMFLKTEPTENGTSRQQGFLTLFLDYDSLIKRALTDTQLSKLNVSRTPFPSTADTLYKTRKNFDLAEKNWTFFYEGHTELYRYYDDANLSVPLSGMAISFVFALYLYALLKQNAKDKRINKELEKSREEAVRINKQMQDYTDKLEEARAEALDARDKAESADLSKSEFLANMSHELRTPMNGIIGMADMLEGTHLDEEQQEYSSLLRSSARSLLLIVNDILDLSKIEAGSMELESTPFPLRKSIADTVELFMGMASKRGIVLSADIASNLPRFVEGDEGRFVQILRNLLGNAIKFTEQGSVHLVANTDKDGYVCIRLTDTGIGIAQDQLQNIF